MAYTESTKRYYWLKLHKDFFDQKQIKALRRYAGGDRLIIIFLKMQLKSINMDCRLYYDGIFDDFADELALDIDESVENVRLVINYMLTVGWIEECAEDGKTFYHIIHIDVGSESSSAQRVRRFREKNRIQQQKALQCNTLVTSSNTEIETDTDTDTDTEKQQPARISALDNTATPYRTILQEASNLQIQPQKALSLIARYGLEKFAKQLTNLSHAINVRNNEAWLHAALQRDFSPSLAANPPSADPNCPVCHGTGKVDYKVDGIDHIVPMECSCIKRRK